MIRVMSQYLVFFVLIRTTTQNSKHFISGEASYVNKRQAVIRSPEQAPRIMQRAVKIALANRTVCRIELPADIAEMNSESEEFIYAISPSDSTIVPGDPLVAKFTFC